MPIQLIISGEHATDLFAEITQFADALRGGDNSPKPEAGVSIKPNASTISAPSTPTTQVSSPATGGKTDVKLTREDQDAAVDEMIAAGAKDERFELLTKGRQKAVEDALAKATAPVVEDTSDDVDDMFDDVEEAAPEITVETVRDLMAKLGKDKDGNAIQDNLIKIRDILTKHVPKGEEVKLGKVPADKLASFHAELKKLEV